MAFSFNNPWLLLLIPVACAIAVLLSLRNLKLSGWRHRTALALRLIALVLLVACIAGFGIRKTSDQVTSVFAVDGSDSTARERELMDSFVKEALKHKKPAEKAGIVSFGTNASVELTPSDRLQFNGIQTKVNGNFTSIEQGLRLAASLIPAGDRKRVILVTDGLENSGDALKQARLLRQQGIALDVFPVETLQGGEVQLKEVVVPEALHLNEKFEIVVRLDSTVRTKGTLKLYTDRKLSAQMDVEIAEGRNNFAFSDVADREGLVTYSAVIEAENDTISRNNEASAFCETGDAARVLVVQDSDEAASELVKILGNDVDVTVSRPENLPNAVEELQKYSAFIISNVSAERLDDKFLTSLETCIKHQGKGLLVTGGENSYAPGGYYKTVLEDVLPVNMDIKPKQEAPNLGLVLVIDKSGSMSGGQYGTSKVELAKEAALRSTEVLKKEDMIGVIAFDSAVQWVVRTQKLNDLKAVQDAIGTIRAAGGTQILPALQEAYESLRDADTKLKHIILLTDGQAEKSGFEGLLGDLAEAGITLSTVAVGQEADRLLLEALAIGGNGRFYMTDVFTDIPKIFAKETFLAGKTYLNNRTFTPNLKTFSDMLKGITAVPVLDGYVGTTAKSTARVIFSSDRDDPVLAAWQYGLGRTVAWTSDAKGMWSSAWMQWEQSPQFWKNIISWLMQRKPSGEYSIKAGMSAGKGTIELTLPPEERGRSEKVEAALAGPSGSEQSISLEPALPGVYRGTFEGDETGVYIANITVRSEDEAVKTISTGVVVPYSPEYDIPQVNTTAFLEKLANEGGGRIIRDSREVFANELPAVTSITDMLPILLPLIIILFLADIAIRRLNLPFDRTEAVIRKILKCASRLADIVIKPFTRYTSPARASEADNDRYAVNSGKNRSAINDDSAGNAGNTGKASNGGTEQRPAAEEQKPGRAAQRPAKSSKFEEASEADAHISALLEKKRKRQR